MADPTTPSLPSGKAEAVAVCDAFDVLSLSEAYGGSGATSVSSKALNALEAAVKALRSALSASAPEQAVKGLEEVAADLADWSNLPKDIYVVAAKSHGDIAFDVTCCSVPMITAPEVRYTRADLASAISLKENIPEPVAVFAQAILHGDDEHRAWLTEAADAFIAGKPLPPPRGKGTAAASPNTGGRA